jgi:metal-responsive CopG/Arc/MetJ family transcriptional regulator
MYRCFLAMPYKDGKSRSNLTSVRLNISLPANLVGEIDRYAAEHHMTRSGFLAKAAQQAMGSST